MQVVSEITGVVFKLLVSEGDPVDEGSPLVILESMKMEIPVLCTEAGTVAHLKVKEGDTIAAGEVILEIATK